MFEKKAKPKPNKRSQAWFLSRITFGYLFKLFLTGKKRTLKSDDFWDLDSEDKAKPQFSKIKKEWEIEQNKSHPNLTKALMRANCKELILISLWVVGSNITRLGTQSPSCSIVKKMYENDFIS